MEGVQVVYYTRRIENPDAQGNKQAYIMRGRRASDQDEKASGIRADRFGRVFDFNDKGRMCGACAFVDC